MMFGGGDCLERIELYDAYKMAYELSIHNGYEVLYLNDKVEEIWLEKLENKISKLVRISTLGFDWKNHLKRDIGIVFQKTKAMQKLLHSKHVEVNNVYITPHSPVDSWEELKKPMVVQDKNPIKMRTFYLSGEDYHSEVDRLEETLAVSFQHENEEQTEIQLEENVLRYKTELLRTIEEKRKKEQHIFSYGKPFITYSLLVINAIMFLLLELNGGSQNTETLLNFGAKYNPAIMDGEWWRIITSMFLHIGLLHFASNMLFLYYFGSLAERIYGSTRYFIIYMLAGIGGGITSFAWMTNLSAGASGALYGLFGAFLYFGIIHKRLFFQTIGKDILVLLAINIGLGFVLPQLDYTAHLGGLVAGFIAAAIVHLPKKRKPLVQVISLIGYTALIVAMFLFGTDHNQGNATYHLMDIERLLEQNRYEEVVDSATKGLEKPGDLEAILLFQRSYALIKLGDVEQATKDLEKCVEVLDDPEDLPEAYYNLAILYNNAGDERATEMIQKAYEANPSSDDIKELYQQITGKTVE
jgi:rhomboid protease GluP